MAVTSEASTITNYPLRTFNAGPGFIREMPARDHQQQTGKKSAMERLKESRGKFLRHGSQEEVEDGQGNETQRKPSETYRAHQVDVLPEDDDLQDHIYRAVPYVYGNDGDKGPQPAKKSRPRPPPPVPDKPRKFEVKNVRKGSRDRTLEIVEASLALSARQTAPGEDDAVLISSQGILSTSSPDSSTSSPQSARENSAAGSRVRKLKEQFLKIGSTESESDSSQGTMTPTELQKSGSSSSSPHSLKKASIVGHSEDSHTPDLRDQTEGTHTSATRWHTSVEKPKVLERSQVEPVKPSKSRSTSSEEDPSPKSDQEMKSDTKQAPAPSPDILTKQTRRQMERFKARHASDAAKENSQERKINRIVLKPPSQAADRKERSSSVNVPSQRITSNPVRPRADTSTDQLLKTSLGKESFARAQVSDQVTAKTVTSEDVRRLRRAKECNVSGKSPERWGDAEEVPKPHRSELCHAVHHVSDNVSALVGSRILPTKPLASHPFQERQQPEDVIGQDSSLEVNHRRAKSDLDQGAAARTQANSHRVRHRSQEDQVQRSLLVPESTRKVSAPNVFSRHARPGPQTTNFQTKSWAPVSFNQSPDIPRAQKMATELLTPQSYAHHHSAQRNITSPENVHAHAKSTLQSFLSGIMHSPGGDEKPISPTKQKEAADNSHILHQTHPQNDGNGNHITAEFPTTGMLSESTNGGANMNETHHLPWEGVSDEVNSNVFFSTESHSEPIRVEESKDVEFTVVHHVKDSNERMKSESMETQADMGHKPRFVKHQNKTNLHHMKQPVGNLGTNELDKRRKFSENSDAAASKRETVHYGQRDEANTNVEEPRVKKVSLSELLSKDVTQARVEALDRTNQLQRPERKMLSRNETVSEWTQPPKPERRHGDDSETNSDEELQRSKVLRVKKSRRHAQKKKEEESWENLLSRIINPDDELNTLKRGQKLSAPSDSKPRATQKPSTDTRSSTTDENEAMVGNVRTTQQKPALRKKNSADEPKVRKPLLNLNLKQGGGNSRAPKRKDPESPQDPLTSPTRQNFPRRRSKSDLGMSPQCSISSPHSDVERFFNQMGLNDSFFQKPFSPLPVSDDDDDEVFHEMHEYKHERGDGGSFSTENSDNISQGSKVSEEGLHLAKKLPDTSQSIITKNARVIKWLCQIRKARASSVS